MFLKSVCLHDKTTKDEYTVELYQTHWWRCNGPCQFRKPHFGIVRRSMNLAPGPKDYWWVGHQRKCGGTFIKIKEPEKKTKQTVVAKPKGDITKYITSNKKTTGMPTGEPKIVQINNKKSSFPNVQTKSNNSSTVVVSQKGISNPVNKPAVKPPSFLTGKGYTIAGTRVRSNSADVTEVVRNIWAKKQLTPNMVSPISGVREKNNNVQKPIIANVSSKPATTNANKDFTLKATKHKTHSEHVDSPPVKVKKIDDYFKKNATSLLKDIYGSNIEVTESGDNKKLIAVNNTNISSLQVVRVDCPICGLKVEESKINSHLDECLNKDMISKICNDNETAASTSRVKIETVPLVNDRNQISPVVVNKVSKQVSQEILATLPRIPPYKPKLQPKQIDLTNLDKPLNTIKEKFRDEGNDWVEVIGEPNKIDENIWSKYLKTHITVREADLVNADKAELVVRMGQRDKLLRRSDSCVIPKQEKDLGSASSSPFIVNNANVVNPPVKVEPGPSRSPTWREMKCPCCGTIVTKPMKEHLDECLAFLNTDPPPEEAPANIASQTIVIDDDDDEFDESQVFNATGTKLPCPCCLQMVENDDMNAHLDTCLG